MKQASILYLFMNKKLTSKSIYLYTLPIILSELLEEVIILSDSILLSFKDPLYLSTVGIIDSVFLLFLTIGDSMNDSFQNFYARHTHDVTRCLGIFKKSIPLFFCAGMFFAILCTLFPLLQRFFDDEHYKVLLSIIPYLSLVICVSFISSSLNSLLMGWGYTKLLGCVSVFSVILNIGLGYTLLYISDVDINPCAVVLITSSISEVFAIIVMSIKVLIIYYQEKGNGIDNRHHTIICKTLIYASVYPCLSDIVFHVGSIALYLYCLFYFLDIQTAVFTLFMSYWGVIKVPSQGFSETSINFFSNLYSKKLTSHYDNIKYKIIKLSFFTSCIFGLAIVFVDTILYGTNSYHLLLLILILVITGLSTYSEIIETSLLVRLKNDSFIFSKILYASILIISIIVFTITNHIGVLSVYVCFLIAQSFNCLYLKIKDNRTWHKRSE